MNEFCSNVRVLAVSPQETDLAVLTRILSHSAWSLVSAASVEEARRSLAEQHAHVVLCERKLPDGDWRDILQLTSAFPDPPQVIVVSKDMDERLWAEVLEHGAWDVLIKPFHPKEVFNTIHLAWQHWTDVRRTPRRPAATSAAASSSGRVGRTMKAAGIV